jgi:hypothetical protein
LAAAFFTAFLAAVFFTLAIGRSLRSRIQSITGRARRKV